MIVRLPHVLPMNFGDVFAIGSPDGMGGSRTPSAIPHPKDKVSGVRTPEVRIRDVSG